MKKLLIIALTILLVMALTACNGDSATESAISSLSDLEAPGVRIGVQNGTTGHLFAEENFPDAEIDAFPRFSDAVMALNAGSIDAVIIDSLPAAEFVTTNDGALTMLDDFLTFELYGITFQHGSYLTALFDDAIDQLKASGVFDEIYDYWIYQAPGASRYVTPPGTEHPNGTLTMATSADFPPFELFEGADIVGFDPCLAQAIGDLIGYDIEIINMLFDSIITGVQAGQYDFGMSGMTITDDRREFVDFSQGYFNSGQVVLIRTP